MQLIRQDPHPNLAFIDPRRLEHLPELSQDIVY